MPRFKEKKKILLFLVEYFFVVVPRSFERIRLKLKISFKILISKSHRKSPALSNTVIIIYSFLMKSFLVKRLVLIINAVNEKKNRGGGRSKFFEPKITTRSV